MRNYLTCLTYLFLLAVVSSCGQTLKQGSRSNNASSVQEEPKNQLARYENLLQEKGETPELLYHAAFTAQKLKRFDMAELYYSKINDIQKTGKYADTDYQMGLVQKGLANYSRAISFFRTYLRNEKNSSNVNYSDALKQIDYCEWAMNQLRTAGPMTIVNLGSHVNSENDELAPLLFADKLYFTAQARTRVSNQGDNRIHSSIQKQDNTIDKANPQNSDAQISNIALTADAKRMYFTICKEEGELFGKDCELYYRDRSYEGEWERHRKLPDNINLKGYGASQPTVGFDKFLRKEVLYFVSDRPGGMGKMDIWAVVIESNSEFGEPFPLPFNSAGDDVTPFYHGSSQTLFFSSNCGKGMGGFDIFSVTRSNSGEWGSAENLGPPLNTSSDEIYYSLHSRAKKAHFSSNRPGSIFNNAQLNRLSYDIYMAEINVEFITKVYSSGDSTDLKGVKLELINLIGRELDAALANSSSNSFNLPLDLENSYAIAASMKGYQPDTVKINTRGYNKSVTFERDIYLKPEMELEVRLFNSVTKKPVSPGTVMVTNEEGSQNWVMDSAFDSNMVSFILERGKPFIVKGHSKGFHMLQVKTSDFKMDTNGKILIDLYLIPVNPVP